MPQFYNVFLIVPFIPIRNGPKTLNIYYSNQNKFLTLSNNKNCFFKFLGWEARWSSCRPDAEWLDDWLFKLYKIFYWGESGGVTTNLLIHNKTREENQKGLTKLYLQRSCSARITHPSLINPWKFKGRPLRIWRSCLRATSFVLRISASYLLVA